MSARIDKEGPPDDLLTGAERASFCGSDWGTLLESAIPGLEGGKLYKRSTLVVRFFDSSGKAVTAGGAGVASLRFTIQGNPTSYAVAVNWSDIALVMALNTLHNYAPDGVSLRSVLFGLRVGTLVTVDALDGSGTVKGTFKVRRAGHVEAYGLDITGGGYLGVWLPVGLYATLLKETPGGREFSAVPIGLALGSRFYNSESSFYLGVSGIAGWSILNTTKPAPSGSMTSASDTVTLGGLTAGILFDINSYLYLAAMYSFNLAKTAGQSDPGFMVGIGFGPGLAQLMTGKSPPK